MGLSNVETDEAASSDEPRVITVTDSWQLLGVSFDTRYIASFEVHEDRLKVVCRVGRGVQMTNEWSANAVKEQVDEEREAAL